MQISSATTGCRKDICMIPPSTQTVLTGEALLLRLWTLYYLGLGEAVPAGKRQ